METRKGLEQIAAGGGKRNRVSAQRLLNLHGTPRPSRALATRKRDASNLAANGSAGIVVLAVAAIILKAAWGAWKRWRAEQDPEPKTKPYERVESVKAK